MSQGFRCHGRRTCLGPRGLRRQACLHLHRRPHASLGRRAASDVQALLSEHVRVLIHQTECATCLAALTQLGRKSQIPPDLLVKFQPIDIVEVIL
jgi:hypothetical protein